MITTVMHDPTLVLSALEELEANRRGLEWLVEADLLWCCLPEGHRPFTASRAIISAPSRPESVRAASAQKSGALTASPTP